MSLRPRSGEQVPSLTAQIARASNPDGTTAMWVRDRLDGLWRDEDFAGWYPRDRRTGISPAQPATVCVLQSLLGLSDRQAAEAVRCRIDFKYAMALELDDPGFHHSVLADFRNVSPQATAPTASSTSRRPVSRRPGWCASAPRSAPTPPMSWQRCVT
ncbi:transposase [Streptomyces sp. NPDC096311]|uniref:transposase n=1 Tax=Streptomyces sp. NPDC096311 TaxID=3366083 RepID=UPI0037F88A82